MPNCSAEPPLQLVEGDLVGVPVLMPTVLGAVSEHVEGPDAGAELAARPRELRRVRGSEEETVSVGACGFRSASRLIDSPSEGRTVSTETEARLLLQRHPSRARSRSDLL